MMSDSSNICVIGLENFGLIPAVCLAEMGHNVICVASHDSSLQMLRNRVAPSQEEYVSELLARHVGGALEFTLDLGEAVRRSEAVFIAVDVPQGHSGEAEVSQVEAAAEGIARTITSPKLIVETCTVPVNTNRWIRRILCRHGVDESLFAIACNPLFVRKGTAVSDFLHPDRIVIGADSANAIGTLQRIYLPLISGAYYDRPGSVPGACSTGKPARSLVTSLESAEIMKHASNAFLALKLSFINAVANLAETVDADIDDISAGIGLDSRIGPQFLRPGLGYGGSSFAKDLAAFNWVAKEQGIQFSLLSEAARINESQQEAFFNKVRAVLWTLRGKRIGVLGLAFKGETDHVRESPALNIIRALLEEGAEVVAFDPGAMDKAKAIVPPSQKMKYADDMYEACRSCDAVLILTDWEQFREIELGRLAKITRFPVVIDGRNIYQPEQMKRHGITYVSIGRPAEYSPDFMPPHPRR